MSYDVIVVGGGTSGRVVAARLSEDPEIEVLLLEKDASVPGIPPRAGGSSATDATVFARGHHASYTDWNQFGGYGWGFADLLPYFMRSETATHGDPALRGDRGPLLVGPADRLSPLMLAFRRAAVERGFSAADDISGGLETGFGPVDLVDGPRESAADPYLAPALGRDNLTVITAATVQRVLMDRNRAVGVEYRCDSKLVTVTAAREVVLAAGAVCSPQLLMLSGIGPARHLRELDADVLVDLPGIGANLQNHPLAGIVYLAAQPLPVSDHRAEMMGLLHTGSPGGAPDLQIRCTDTAGATGAVFGVETCFIGVSPMHPHSRGTVRLAGLTAEVPPVVNPHHLEDERDMKTMLDGLDVARQIGASPELRPWLAEELAPGAHITDEDRLREYIRTTGGNWFHPVGTCALGESKMSVVDSRLRVRGTDGLRVIDASVMPSLPSNNIVATVYAIAERGAEMVRDELAQRHW